jgi:hypothetical protein
MRTANFNFFARIFEIIAGHDWGETDVGDVKGLSMPEPNELPVDLATTTRAVLGIDHTRLRQQWALPELRWKLNFGL